MSSTPVWFGEPHRPLAGWIHTPDTGRVRGSVVLCPPIGLEYINSHRGIRFLAERLAEAGFLALRFDYQGTGDSTDEEHPAGHLDFWRGSVSHASTLVQQCTKAPTMLVGLRFGALLAADYARPAGAHGIEDYLDAQLRGLILWDPVYSGRRFFREQSVLGMLAGIRQPDDGAVDAPGFRYDADTVRSVRNFELPTLKKDAPFSVGVLERAERPLSPEIIARLGCDRLASVHGQPAWLDVDSPRARTPVETINLIVDWAEAIGGSDEYACGVPGTGAARWGSSAGWLEETVHRVGPAELCVVDTHGPSSPTGEVVLLLNNAVEHHVGPARMWTEAARQWAVRGLRVLRADLSGIGDSGCHPGAPIDLMYSRHAVDDVCEIVHAMDIVPERLTLVGLCSGGNLAVAAAAKIGAHRSIAINPITLEPIEPLGSGSALSFGRAPGIGRRLARRVHAYEIAARFRRSLRDVARRLPAWWWGLADALRLVHSPLRSTARSAATNILLICGDEDAYQYETAGKWHKSRMTHANRLRYMRIAGLAHVPMASDQRAAVRAELDKALGIDIDVPPSRLAGISAAVRSSSGAL